MTSWHWEPGEDFPKYEREDALTPAQTMQELEDALERPYGSHYYGPKRGPLPKMMDDSQPDVYIWRCERCGHENKDSGCDFCGGICRRVKK